jgi:hypothetical protein
VKRSLLRRQIERLPPYPSLLILAVPLAVVEPLKFATIFIAGEGHWITGGLVLLFAYAVSLFVTHWLLRVVKHSPYHGLHAVRHGSSRFVRKLGDGFQSARPRCWHWSAKGRLSRFAFVDCSGVSTRPLGDELIARTSHSSGTNSTRAGFLKDHVDRTHTCHHPRHLLAWGLQWPLRGLWLRIRSRRHRCYRRHPDHSRRTPSDGKTVTSD